MLGGGDKTEGEAERVTEYFRKNLKKQNRR